MDCKCIERSGTTNVECCNQCGASIPSERWNAGPTALQELDELSATVTQLAKEVITYRDLVINDAFSGKPEEIIKLAERKVKESS